MPVKLRRTLKIETVDEAGRLVTRMFVGDDELPSDPALLRAVAQLAAGAPVLDIPRLTEAGVLEVDEVPMPPDDVSVVLDPFAVLETPQRPVVVTLPSTDGPVRRRVEASGELPVELFVPPQRLRPLQDLARKVRTRFQRAMSRSIAATGSVDRAALAADLGAWAAAEVERDPALQPVLGVESDRLVAIAELQDASWHYPVAGVRVYVDRGHAEAQQGARGSVAFSVQGSVDDARRRLVQVGQLLGGLQRGSTRAELLEALQGGSAQVEQLWRQLARAGVLPPYQQRPGLHEGLEDGQARFLGHGTLLARLGSAHVAFDPWFVPSSSADQPPALVDLPPLDGIFLTGAHWDRAQVETLLRLDKSTPCFVPAQPTSGCVPHLDRFLGGLGFSSVRTLGHGEAVSFGESGVVQAMAMPGRDPTRSGAVDLAYVWSSGGTTALLHNGGGVDADGRSVLTTDAVAEAVQTYGPLKRVFASRRCEHGSMLDYGWTFLLRPFSEWTQRAVFGFADADFLAELVQAAQAEALVVVGEGGAPWYPSGRVGVFPDGAAAEAAGWPGLDTLNARVSVPVTRAEVGSVY